MVDWLILEGTSGLNPLLRLATQSCLLKTVQMAFVYLQGWRLHSLYGQSMPVLSHPHSKKLFPDVQRNLP